jgi:hypothetical protein
MSEPVVPDNRPVHGRLQDLGALEFQRVRRTLQELFVWPGRQRCAIWPAAIVSSIGTPRFANASLYLMAHNSRFLVLPKVVTFCGTSLIN